MKLRLFALAGWLLAFLFLPALFASKDSVLSAMPRPHTYKLYCASDDFYRHFCPINGFGGVEIIRQKSEAQCIYGRTWGLSGDAIWVDRGCRADFVVGAGERAGEGGYGGGRVFYCASDDFNVHGCPVDTYSGVRLVRQRSEAPCIYGRTWGYDNRGVWVDRGCRADFEIGASRSRDRYRDHDRNYDRDDRDDRDNWRH